MSAVFFILGTALTGAALGSLVCAASLGNKFTLSGRGYYSIIAALIFLGVVLNLFSKYLS